MIMETQNKTIIVNTIKENILKNSNGITLNFKGDIQNFRNGFYVSITNNKIDLKKIDKSIKQLIQIKKQFFSELNNLFIGSWIDEKENVLYLDLSFYIEDKNTALNTAQQFKQKAVFDILNLNSVYL